MNSAMPTSPSQTSTYNKLKASLRTAKPSEVYSTRHKF